ncbi:probable GPI-anchored adhesin-like protein PGA55 [Nasonia vitripennis]|uniref:SAP domain-containing protein n=1 Tax=Nasonia vitripennis TaxID=7425 RepID=A0A7M7QDI4_NASVI|nr:probable GPI-anchored adhesin-like protein PGA55 [Nasonia vitripennis]
MSSHSEIMSKLRKSPEVRNLSREIRKLHTTELKARLRSLGANTNGPKDLRQDRLLRAVLWCTGYQKSVPWYDWDNAKEEPTQSSENFTSRRNSKRKHEQTYGEETEKIRVTKMKSRSDYVDRGQDHENQDSSSKAKPQHQKEKVSKKKIRRLRGRVRSRNRDRSQSSNSSSSRSSRSLSSSSSSSSSSSTSSSSSSRSSSSSSRSSRSPSSSSSSSSSSSTSSNSSGRSSSSSSRSSWSSISSRSNSRASRNSSSNSRSSSISSFDSRYLEPESDSAKKIAEPVIYSSPFEDCQVCGFKDVVFQSCPNCAELRTSVEVQKTGHARSALQRGMPVLGGGGSGPSPLVSPEKKLRRKHQEIGKGDVEEEEKFLVDEEKFSVKKRIFVERRNCVEEKKKCRVEEKKKGFVEEDKEVLVEKKEEKCLPDANVTRWPNRRVAVEKKEEKLLPDANATRWPNSRGVAEKEDDKLLLNANVTRWLNSKVLVEKEDEKLLLNANATHEEKSSRGSAEKSNLELIPTSSLSSPMVTDHCEDTKAQPVMLSPAANSRGRIRKTLAQYERKNESVEESTFLPLTKLQTRTQPQPALQPDQVNRQDASSTSGFQPDDKIKKCSESAFLNEEKMHCRRRMLESDEEKKTYANADATRWLSNIVVMKPRTTASAVTAWPSSSDDEEEKKNSRCRAVKLCSSVIPSSSNDCLSSHKATDRREDTNVQPFQLKSAANSSGRIMDSIAQDEVKNESGENPRDSSLSILQPRANFQPLLQPDRINRQDASSTSGFQPDGAIKKSLEASFADEGEVLEQKDVEEKIKKENMDETTNLLPGP